MKIIIYNSYSDIVVEFQDEHKYTTNATYNNFKKSKIRNPYDKEYYGVGFLGRAYYKNEKFVDSISFKTWEWMLQRCYSKKALKRNPTYEPCYVCEEWHEYYNFKIWFEENYYTIENEIMEIDKDILFKGNKMLEFSVKINPSLEKVAINAIKDVLKKIDPSAIFVQNSGLSKSDEDDFKELLKDKKAGKLEFINADEMWANIDKTIAKYE